MRSSVVIDIFLRFGVLQKIFLSYLFQQPYSDILKNRPKYLTALDVSPEIVNLIFFPSAHQTDVDLSKEIKIIIHGWQGHGELDWIVDMVHKYHKRGIYNVLSLDYSQQVDGFYYLAAQSARSVGIEAGNQILKMLNNDVSVLNRIHLVGFSLGAHVAGFIGSHIYNKTRHKINRITALDGAGPYFEFPFYLDHYDRISKDDANFVDAIHTNKKLLGLDAPYGHLDFYVNNGGPFQPGCSFIVDFFLVTRGSQWYSCSHSRAHLHFRETISNPDKYKFWYCAGDDCNWNYMGEGLHTNASGIVHIKTK